MTRLGFIWQPSIVSLALKFQNAGYRVLTAADGESGLRQIRDVQPNAVICDMALPGLDGRSLCEKTNVLKEQVPFLTLIVTGHSLSKERDWVQDMTDTRFIEKPFSPAKLLTTVDEYFGVPHE